MTQLKCTGNTHPCSIADHLWVAVDLRGGGKQESSTDPLCQAQHVECAHCVGLKGLDRIVHVFDGGGRRCEMVDLVHFQHQRVHSVMVEQLKVLMTYPGGWGELSEQRTNFEISI